MLACPTFGLVSSSITSSNTERKTSHRMSWISRSDVMGQWMGFLTRSPLSHRHRRIAAGKRLSSRLRCVRLNSLTSEIVKICKRRLSVELHQQRLGCAVSGHL